jgi:hypothetical protein
VRCVWIAGAVVDRDPQLRYRLVHIRQMTNGKFPTACPSGGAMRAPKYDAGERRDGWSQRLRAAGYRRGRTIALEKIEALPEQLGQTRNAAERRPGERMQRVVIKARIVKLKASSRAADEGAKPFSVAL